MSVRITIQTNPNEIYRTCFLHGTAGSVPAPSVSQRSAYMPSETNTGLRAAKHASWSIKLGLEMKTAQGTNQQIQI